jgi:hypothetical protein
MSSPSPVATAVASRYPSGQARVRNSARMDRSGTIVQMKHEAQSGAGGHSSALRKTVMALVLSGMVLIALGLLVHVTFVAVLGGVFLGCTPGLGLIAPALRYRPRERHDKSFVADMARKLESGPRRRS